MTIFRLSASVDVPPEPSSHPLPSSLYLLQSPSAPSQPLEDAAVSGVWRKLSHLSGGTTLRWVKHNLILLWWSQRRTPGQVHALGGHSWYFQVTWAQLGPCVHREVFHSAAWEFKTEVLTWFQTSNTRSAFQLINMSDISPIKLQSPSLQRTETVPNCFETITSKPKHPENIKTPWRALC